jgi:phosphopantothenoylcysteine decarboxylase/phosphopantothenate--cysteine ligase
MEEGKAKIAEVPQIVLEVERLLGPGDLRDRKILVTSGATAERVDPIRILTNRASGRTGVEIALEAYRRGARVTIVHRTPQGLPFKEILVESAEDMLQAAIEELKRGYVALISAAAIGDYTLDPAGEKIKSGGDLVLKLRPTRKMIQEARQVYPYLKIVGFKAETNVTPEELVLRARDSMEKAQLDLVVANDVGQGGMGSQENHVLILGRSGPPLEVKGKKSLIARRILDSLVEVLG